MNRFWLVVALAACKDKEPPTPALVQPPPPLAQPASPVERAAKAETIEAWDKAAADLDATVAACTAWTAECAEAGRDAVEARGRALALEHLTDPRSPMVPVALPARAVKLIAACDTYAKRASADDPELPVIELAAARQEWSYGWADRAVPRFEEIVREHRDSEAAALAIPKLLEGLRRQGKAADMRRWVDSLRADGKLMAARPDLRELLDGLAELPAPK